MQNFPGFLVGFPYDAVAGLVNLFLLGFQTFLQRLYFSFIGFDFSLFLLNGKAAVFQICKQILEAFLILCNVSFGILDDMIRQAQPCGNGEGVALAGYADEQAVSGPESLHVKFAAGVFHKRRGEGVDL